MTAKAQPPAPVESVGATAKRPLSEAAKRALAEAAARRAQEVSERPRERGGRDGPDPARYGDWESRGLAVDF
ncbi:MAG: DUF1674 domain-containing protein [Hyphomicrobiales bacterium]|nr:DUF1674 domain-containing protein [Hyphomicrobiales bacterium]